MFSNSACSNPTPSVSGPPDESISQSLIEQLILFHVANAPETPNAIPAPGCNQQHCFDSSIPALAVAFEQSMEPVAEQLAFVSEAAKEALNASRALCGLSTCPAFCKAAAERSLAACP